MSLTKSVEGTANSPRMQALQSEMRALSRRDGELWCIGLLALVLLLIGLSAAILPALREVRRVQLDTRLIAPLAYGLVSLIVLLAFHLSHQRRLVHVKTEALLYEICRNTQLEKLAFIDPITQLFKQAYLQVLLDTEVKRANQQGTFLTFASLQLRTTSDIPSGGEYEGELARLLRSNFRGSDTILTCGKGRYLIVMPDTTEEQAGVAMRRLQARIDQWNITTQSYWEMLLSYGVGSCAPGEDTRLAMEVAERQLESWQPLAPAALSAAMPSSLLSLPSA